MNSIEQEAFDAALRGDPEKVVSTLAKMSYAELKLTLNAADALRGFALEVKRLRRTEGR